MGKQKKESYFWASFSDLMTSLFFVMLVLFVLTIALLHTKMIEIENERKASEEQLKKITEIEEAVNSIEPKYFDYNPTYKKHVLKITVNFPKGESDMEVVDSRTKGELSDAGISIRNSLFEIRKKYPKIQYLLIIEGQASKDAYQRNYELSYERALSLSRFWKNNGIDFGNNCEMLISGSGTGGTMRESEESMNQRFLIHIVPKPGIIEASKVK